MKTIITTILLGVLATHLVRAADETTTNTPAPAEVTAPATPEATATPVPAPAVAAAETNAPVLLPNGEPGVRMNFRGVPLELVLNHLSEAAGFTIVLDTKVTGKIDAWSNQPLSKDEAVDLLNSVLNKNGYAAIRHGRTLTIVSKDEAKTKDIPVILESDPDKIPKTDEMVTQIMPVRFIEVGQLVKDLQPLVSTATTMSANEAGNSIIMTDTRANIHRVAQIIRAIDQGAEDVTEVRVFRLEYADPTEMAALLTSLFSESGTTSGSQTPVQFGGRGGGGGLGRFFGGGGGNDASSGNSQSQRIKKRTKVTAVADPRTSSVLVSATSGLIGQIEQMIKQLDANPAKKQKVYVYQVNPGDVTQMQQVLEDMFETQTTGNNRNNRNSSSQQNNVLQNRANQNQTTSGTSSGNNSTRNNNRSGQSSFGF
jgi:general secretion pathway protein D